MGGFTLITDRNTPGNEGLEDRHLAAMSAQGFAAPRRLVAGDSVLFVYPKQIASVENVRLFPGGDFVIVCGTFFYRGQTGIEGLEQIYREFAPPAPHGSYLESEPLPAPLRGTYVCLVYKANRLWAFTDRIGFYKVYDTLGGQVLTSSFLTALACTPSPRLHPQCVYEYIFQGATYGGETVIEGIKLLDPDCLLVLDPAGRREYRRPDLAPPVIEKLSLQEHCERIGTELDRVFDECIQAFNGRIDTALSGGYDSRLILAHLLSRGVTPTVHVYGRDEDDDVQVAKAIAAGEGFPLTHIDKSRYRDKPTDEEWAAVVERNFQAFDGLPTDGIFDNGADLATRQDRALGGTFALNGGGGEIFRNFFYLRDRPFSARELVWTFYSQFDSRCFAVGNDPREYQERIAEKISRIMGVTGRRLIRAEVERVYPLFRCRYWMGKNSSINNRFGLMHTPLVEPRLVQAAGAAGLALKNTGLLASSLIMRASPQLAKYMSSYGYPFDKYPPLKQRMKDMLSSIKPPRIRKMSFSAKARMSEYGKEKSEQHHFLASLIGGSDDSIIGDFLRIERISEPSQVQRAFTLQYLFRQLR